MLTQIKTVFSRSQSTILQDAVGVMSLVVILMVALHLAGKRGGTARHGISLGGLLGALGSYAVPGLVSALESLLGFQFLNTDVYPVSFVPVDLLLRDVLLVGAVALVMCLVAAIYPARRAAGLAPAMVLNQDRG